MRVTLRNPARRRGFSLIEVLVAMAILTIIVLIVAGIFQQTSLAWSLGLRRADEQSAVRAVVGAALKVFLELARIFVEILVRAELRGVHEYRDHHDVRKFLGPVDKAEVPLMQGAHCGDQRDFPAFGLCRVRKILHFLWRSYDFH